MDRKSILVLVVCFALLLTWGKLVQKMYPTPPAPTNQVATATSPVTAGTNAAAMTAAVSNQAVSIASSSSAPKFVVQTNVPEELLTITNANARYTFTSRGGGLKEIELVRYPETVATRRNKNITGGVASLNGESVAPVFAMIGDVALQGDGNFKLTPIANGVRAEKALTNGLTLVKEFQLSTNYLVTATVRWLNGSKQPILIPGQAWVMGTATPMGPQDKTQGEMVFWYDGAKSAKVNVGYFDTNTTRMFLFSRTPLTEYKAGESNVFWASAQNQYFALATIMGTNTPASSLKVHTVDLPKPSKEEIAATPGIVADPKGLQMELYYPERTVAAGQAAELHFDLFAGPKEYETLALVNARFKNDIDQVMDFGFFGIISKALLVTMNYLYAHVVASYGAIIVLITIVIKMIFWPLTRASTRSMKRMQAFQPQLKALQEKYKDDPQKFSQKQWEFYKKNKVNPLGGCLPMVLQLPVFFGLLTMLRNAIELRGAHFLWISDLSQADTIVTLAFLPGHPLPLNLMPILMGASQFWLMSFTPPSPGMDPAQQKMMRYMPLVMVYFLYNYSAGLALYWTVSNLLSVLQNKLTKTQPDVVVPATVVPAGPPKKKK